MTEFAQVVLITGGGSGMGREAARRFASRGETVALMDVDTAGMQETAAGFDSVHSFAVDITDFAAVSSTVQQIENSLGPIEKLYNCAAIMPFGILVEQDNGIIHKQMAINYGGLVNVARRLSPSDLTPSKQNNFHVEQSGSCRCKFTSYDRFHLPRWPSRHIIDISTRWQQRADICPNRAFMTSEQRNKLVVLGVLH